MTQFRPREVSILSRFPVQGQELVQTVLQHVGDVVEHVGQPSQDRQKRHTRNPLVDMSFIEEREEFVAPQPITRPRSRTIVP